MGNPLPPSILKVSLPSQIFIFLCVCCFSAEADHAIPAAERTTTPYMTKYERARVLGTRALQIRFV